MGKFSDEECWLLIVQSATVLSEPTGERHPRISDLVLRRLVQQLAFALEERLRNEAARWISKLIQEKNDLAAWQCPFHDGKTGLTSDEHGHQYRNMERERDEARADAEAVEIERNVLGTERDHALEKVKALEGLLWKYENAWEAMGYERIKP